MRKLISPTQRLLCTLRYLATGVNFEELKLITVIASQTLSKVIIKTFDLRKTHIV